MADRPNLTATEGRVLGALIEKQLTTPDAYPLTLNALTAACNQSSNRDPVVRYEPYQVETTVLVLKSKGLARVVHPGSGERATKYRQIADEVLGLSPPERALVTLLLLRGPQTVGELRARSDRLYAFGSGEEVEAALAALAAREAPLAVRLERQPGQKDPRWVQLLEDGSVERARAVAATEAAAPVGTTARSDRIGELEARVEALEARLTALTTALGDLVALPAEAADESA